MGKNHMFKKSGFWLILLLILSSCQKDDVKQESSHHFSDENLNHKMVTADDIPEVMQFLRGNSSPNLYFTIQTGELPEGQNRSGEPDLIISELMTEQILAVTNEANLTNYSFQLRVDNAPYYEGEVSFFNLIVKETTAVEGYYAYIQEYRMDENWYVDNDSILDMQTYTGKMIFYTLEGLYVAKVDFSNGQIIGEDLRSPCPPDPGGGSSGGGGSGSGPGDGGTGGSGGGTGGGTGGGGIQIIVVGCTCANPPHQPGETCTCENPPYIVIVWGDEIDDINETLRNPCCDPPCELPIECNYPNGDPCPCNATNDGCLDENPNVGVIHIKPHPHCDELLKISNHANTRNKINQLKNELNSGIEKGFEIEMQNGEISNSTPIRDGEFNEFIYNFQTLNPVAGLHLHHSKLFPMPSHEDILTLFNFFGNSPTNSNIPTHIIVSSKGVHALKIDDPSKLATLYVQAATDPEFYNNLRDNMLKTYENINPIVNGVPTGTLISNEMAFLELIEQYDMGISLLRANSDTSGWVKLILNENNNLIWSYECNY